MSDSAAVDRTGCCCCCCCWCRRGDGERRRGTVENGEDRSVQREKDPWI